MRFDTHRIPGVRRPAVLACLIALAATAIPIASSAQSASGLSQESIGHLTTSFDAKEGGPWDLAVQRDALVGPGTKRAFTAAGRRRWQHNADTMERMLAEEKLYDLELTAVELSSDDRVLFTTTTRTLHRELLSGGPPGPFTLEDVWTLPEDPALEDEIQDVKVLPAPHQDAGIYVLTRQRMYVLTYDGLTRTYTQHDVEPRPAGFYNLTNLEVHQNIEGNWRGYVMGIAYKPGAPGTTRGIAVLALGDPLGTPATHDLQFIVGPAGDVWDPRLDSQIPPQYTVSGRCFNLVLKNEGGTTKAYVACGYDRQLTVLDTMYAGEDAGQWTHELNPQVPPRAVLERIVLEHASFAKDQVKGITWANDPSLLVLTDTDKIWVVDPTPGAGFVKSKGDYNFGAKGGFEIGMVAFGDPLGQQDHAWTVAKGTTTHVVKRFKIVTPSVPAQVRIYENGFVYGMSTTDGAVALPDPASPQNSVIYLPTFGGVVKFTTQDATEPQTFTVDVDSYRPAQWAGGGIHTTEQIAIGDVAPFGQPADMHIFTHSAQGDFLEYDLDANLDPQVPVLRHPPAGCPPWLGSGDYIYGTSIELSDQGADGKWVLYDLVNRTRAEIALVACRVDVNPVVWKCVVADDQNLLNPNLWTWSLNATQNWALITYQDGTQAANGDHGGFLVFDLRDLEGPGFEAQSPTYVPCGPFDKVGGVAMNADENRILASCSKNEASYNPGTQLAGGVILFGFDGSSGSPQIQRLEELLEEPYLALQGGPDDDFHFPGLDVFDDGYRCRWFEHQGRDTWVVTQYVGGYAYQFSARAKRRKQLYLDAFWHGRMDLEGEDWQGYHKEGQDVRVYDFGFGQRILHCQNDETFVILEPFSQTTPVFHY